jgi:hypothetical protein
METPLSRRPEIGTRDTLGECYFCDPPDYHNDLPTPPFRLPWPLVQGSLGAFLMTGPETECFRAHTNADVRTRTEPRP